MSWIDLHDLVWALVGVVLLTAWIILKDEENKYE